MTRRFWMAGAGTVTLGSLGVAAYCVSPRFWHQYAEEFSRPILDPSHHPNPAAWPDKGLHAAWLGHATVLLKIDGYTILTDPVFSDKAGLNIGPLTLGVKRMVAPALHLNQLPPVNLVLISHAHMDHLDVPSLRNLENNRRDIIAAWETSDLFRPARYRSARELRWGRRLTTGPASITAIEVNHWGARMRTDTYRGYNGYLIETRNYRVLFAGDTADTHLFRQLHSLRGIDLAIMPIGAYNPWIRYHCTPEQAWRMGNEARAQFFLPVHHQTFSLSREPRLEPIERFHAAAGPALNRIAAHSIGQEFHLS
jgi:L-ascorbate metabolism protein UlaG (beta-lactamase superfamily)